MINNYNLDKYTVKELKIIAKKENCKGYSTLLKKDIIILISNNRYKKNLDDERNKEEQYDSGDDIDMGENSDDSEDDIDIRTLKKINKTTKKNIIIDDDSEDDIDLRTFEKIQKPTKINEVEQKNLEYDSEYDSYKDIESIIKSSQEKRMNEKKDVSEEVEDEVDSKPLPCIEYENLLEHKKDLNKKIQEKNRDCEEKLYKKIKKYFQNKKDPNCYDLLIALYSFYKKEYDNIKPLYFHNFINMFEKSTTTDTNFKRQHVFEAICKLLLFFNYDKGELGSKKKFFSSLEDLIKNPNLEPLKDSDILESKINEGSKAGVVDILFISDFIEDNLCNDNWACDCIEPKNEPKRSKRREKFNKYYKIEREDSKSENEIKNKKQYIMIQNKYYGKEKADIEKYDVSKIYSKADKMSKINNDFTKKIVLMVNNEDSLQEKINRSRNMNKNLIDKIYGVKTLEDWFRLLLNDFEKYFVFDKKPEEIINIFIEDRKKNINKNKLNPRFHQRLITDSTHEYYEKEGYRLFIWGAVPRSGKSYMIAEMVAKRNDSDNDIVIILGAKSETECQFIKMFKSYSDFDTYNIINNNKKCSGRSSNNNNKNIYIFSQEFFKKNKIINENYSDSFKEKYSSIFKKGKIDLYFDEIHKGGTTDRSQLILNAFKNSNVQIDLFIMVTATFAKPKIRYNTNFIDINNKKTKLIEWSYEDQQNTKNLTNQTQKEIMLNTRSELEKEVMIKIFDDYEKEYGYKYLDIISKDYKNNPELVILQPDINIELKKIFDLKCSGCKNEQTLYDFMNPDNIFEQSDRISELLDDKNIGSIYSQLFNMEAPIGNIKSDPHSELWFLPDKNLYPKELNCKLICKEIEYDDNYDDEKNVLKGVPNIEPLTRGLSLMLMEHEYFRKNYNVVIVHNSAPNYKIFKVANKKPYSIEEIYREFEKKGIKMLTNSDNIGEDIKMYEQKTYKENKSLIILTGGKLRLGVSLPCVDIAFNFDNLTSIDNNYQTMFRVLTERYNKPKKYGYYVDFNKERTIQFIYEFNKIYGMGKKIPDIKDNVEYLKSLLSLFNFNGLGIIKQNTEQEIKLYNRLIKKLEINEEKYIEFYMRNDNIVNLIKKTLFVENIDSKILKFIKNSFQFDKIKDIKENLKKGEIKEGREEDDENEENEENEENDENKDKEEYTDEETLNHFSEIIKELTFLFALFSQQNYYNCDDLEVCIKNCRNKIKDFEKLICVCNNNSNIGNDIYICYMNNLSEKPYSKEQLLKILDLFEKFLENDELKNVLKFIFNSIKTKMSSDKNLGLIYSMSEKDILDTIKKYLPIRNKEKQDNGEVFTPYELIDEMIDKLPEEVWTNPNLKWLDPANGIGNFPMVIYKRLMITLEDVKGLKDKLKRHKHIIENMLYMVELIPRNVEISKRIFGEEANIYCGDFLEDDWKEEFKIEEFDIVIGNPPFNKGIYKKFIKNSLSITDNLNFIIPSNFTINITGKKLVELLKKNGLKYIQFLGRESFLNKIDQDTLYFLTVKNYEGDILVNNNMIDRNQEIINYTNDIEHNIFNKLSKKEHIQLFKGKNKTLKYKDPEETDNIKFKKQGKYKNMLLSRLNGGRGDEIYYINEYKKDYPDNYKIVFPRGTGSYKSINNLKNFDKDIVYNKLVDKETLLSDGLMYVLLDRKSDYDYIKNYLMRHKLIRFIFIRQNKYSELTPGLFNYIPKIPVDVLKDNKIYEYLNFTKEEIKYIEHDFWKSI